MSIESIQSRISEIESMLSALNPQQAPTRPERNMNIPGTAPLLPGIRPFPGTQMPDSLDVANGKAPFDVHLANQVGSVRLRPLTSVDKAAPYEPIIQKYSAMYNVRPELVKAVMIVESDANPNCRSAKGAAGLMQIMPEEFAGYGITDPYDPDQSIRAGVCQLAAKLRKYNGDERLALAAYNAGTGNVRKYGGIPPFKETLNYIPKVLELAQQFSRKSEESR